MKDDRALPNDPEIEAAVLGALLTESDAINSVIGELNDERIFYQERNRKVWLAIKSLYHRNAPVDAITVMEEMKKLTPNYLKEIAEYLTKIMNSIGSAAHVEQHVLILKEMFVSRRLIEIAQKCLTNAYDKSFDVFDVQDSLLTEIDELTTTVNRIQTQSLSELIDDKVTHLKEAASSKSYYTGLATGLDEFDRVTLGWQDTDLIIIAARPAMGKTALAVDIARKQSKKDNPIAMFSLEMSASQLVDRLISAETSIPLENVRKGGLKYDEWQVFDRHTISLKSLPIYICDKGGLTLNEICAIAKNWKIKHKIKAVYIDYLQLINNSAGKKNANREQDVSEISRRLKQLAKELHIPVIALSQLSRAVESRSDKRPMLSDLRESGSIEQDADVVVFPFREDYYSDTAEPGKTELIIAKHRNGKTGMVDCYFDGERQTFTNTRQTAWSN